MTRGRLGEGVAQSGSIGAWSLVYSVLLFVFCARKTFFPFFQTHPVVSGRIISSQSSFAKMSSSAPQAGGSTPKASPSSRTLDDTMREPSTSVPAVVVLDSLHPDEKPKVSMDPKKDLWLSTVDG